MCIQAYIHGQRRGHVVSSEVTLNGVPWLAVRAAWLDPRVTLLGADVETLRPVRRGKGALDSVKGSRGYGCCIGLRTSGHLRSPESLGRAEHPKQSPLEYSKSRYVCRLPSAVSLARGIKVLAPWQRTEGQLAVRGQGRSALTAGHGHHLLYISHNLQCSHRLQDFIRPGDQVNQ